MNVGGIFFTVVRENFSPDIGLLIPFFFSGDGMSDRTQKLHTGKKKKKVILYVFLDLNSILLQWRITLHL